MGSEIAMYGFPKEKLSDSPGLQFFFFFLLCFIMFFGEKYIGS